MNRKILLSLLLLFGIYAVRAQHLSGYVYELNERNEKNVLPGVALHWIGSGISAFTDEKGRFKISMEGIRDSRLVVSLMGYKTDTVLILSSQKEISLQLKKIEMELPQVEINEQQDARFISKVATHKTEVLTQHELYKAACCNLSESFETNASVDVTYSDAITGAKQIQLLGLSGIYSQVQIENIPLMRGLASTYGLNYIPGAWMQSIQISKGSSSVVNGYESVTGQINVEYKKPALSDKFHLNIYGNDKTRMEANVLGSRKITEHLSTMLMLHGSYFNRKINKINTSHINGVNENDLSLITDGQGNPVRIEKPDNFLDMPLNATLSVFSRTDYEVHKKICARFGVKYLYEDRKGGTVDFSKKGFILDTSKINKGTLPYGFGLTTNRVEVFWKNGFMWQDKPWRSFALVLSGVYHDQSGFFGVNDYHGYERSLYAQLIYQSQLGSHEHRFSTGAAFLYDDITEQLKQIRFVYQYQTKPAGSIINMQEFVTLSPRTNLSPEMYDFSRHEIIPGAFFEYTGYFREVLTLIIGLRADYSNRYGFFFTPRTHLKWNITETLTLRGSAGLGYRAAEAVSDNLSLLASQKKLMVSENLKQEKAVNYGINLNKEFKIAGRKASLDMDVYRTDFINQVIADIDIDPAIVYFYNLCDSNGKSFSNSYQIQFAFEPLSRLNLLAAFRINDARQTTAGKLQPRVLLSRYKGLLTLSYATKAEKWKLDFTTQLNGPSRIPNQENMPEILKRNYRYSPVYPVLNAQISKKFKYEIEVYVGAENLLNYRQKDPITVPFLPYHTYFDTSVIWGPLSGRMVYAGLRYSIP